jgi:hypothetical protein
MPQRVRQTPTPGSQPGGVLLRDRPAGDSTIKRATGFALKPRDASCGYHLRAVRRPASGPGASGETDRRLAGGGGLRRQPLSQRCRAGYVPAEKTCRSPGPIGAVGVMTTYGAVRQGCSYETPLSPFPCAFVKSFSAWSAANCKT